VSATTSESLPELANVYWRPLASPRRLDRIGWFWTGWTAAHTVPFVAAAAVLVALKPLTAPVALVCLVHAWAIPELYAARGAIVVKRGPAGGDAGGGHNGAERCALGLLGDLLDHDTRALQERSGLALEQGALGVWLVGQAGALLVRPGGRRVYCYCIRVSEPGLPVGDRIAHLLLALRSDEQGFATVANLAFAGARWRVRRRLAEPMREALDVAGRQARR
jgi:hypothetical protein